MTRCALLSCLAVLLFTGAEAGARTAATPRPGFPAFPPGGGGGVVTYNKALVVDLDNNGGPKSIVVGTDQGQLFVFDSAGHVRPGWPQTPCPGDASQPLASEIVSSPAAGQLDDDQPLEIVVGCGSLNPDRNRGGVVAFKANGTVLWRFATMDTLGTGKPNPVWSTPALGDLDGDGKDDVVFGATDAYVYALKGTNGTLLPGWPVFVRDTVFSSPALADLDGDGKLEVIIGADVHAEPPPINTPTGGALWVFRHDGSQFPGFPVFTNFGIGSSPAVGDITGDGCPDIVVGTAFPAPPYSDTTGRELHAWSRDGKVLPGWPVALVGHPNTSPALANLDGDPALEVVATVTKPLNGNPTGEGWVYGIKGNGTIMPGFPLRPITNNVSADSLEEPIVVRYGSAATDPSIFVGGLIFEVGQVSKTGAQLSDPRTQPSTALYYETNRQVFGPAAADLGANGTLALVAADGRIATSPNDLAVYAWNLGSLTMAQQTQPWPMYRQGPQRRGTAPGTTGCPLPNPPFGFYTITPCRVSDSRQSGFLTYGGPALAGGEQRTITIPDVPGSIPSWRSACGVPATAKAVSINVTVTLPTVAGSLTLFPGGDGLPPTTTLNFKAGQTRANNAVLPLSFDSRGNLTVSVGMPPTGQVHVIIDVNGYFQ